MSAAGAFGHEFWIAPEKFQVMPGTEIVADVRNGEMLNGFDLAYYPMRVLRLEAWTDATATIDMRAGDKPAIRFQSGTEAGLVTLIYESNRSTVTYRARDKFDRFLDHKDLGWAREEHIRRALPETGFSEVYSRYCKALVAVGSGLGADRETGLEHEFVALTNPYARGEDTMRVRLLYQGRARADAQIEVFAKAPDGSVTLDTVRTDSDGVAVIPAVSGHDYLLNAVVMRVPTPEIAQRHDAVWETLWASLTYSFP